MSVAPGARFAIRMQVRDGELYYRQCKMCSVFVGDAATAIRLLLRGDVVWVKQDARLINSVQRIIEGRA